MKRGFTLIELSIVLVIIGLIVGGILVGQDLINAAAIRAQIAQVEKYQTANQYDHVRLLDAQGVTRLSVPAGLPAVSSSVAKSVSEVLR